MKNHDKQSANVETFYPREGEDASVATVSHINTPLTNAYGIELARRGQEHKTYIRRRWAAFAIAASTLIVADHTVITPLARVVGDKLGMHEPALTPSGNPTIAGIGNDGTLWGIAQLQHCEDHDIRAVVDWMQDQSHIQNSTRIATGTPIVTPENC